MRAKGSPSLVDFACKHSWTKYWSKFQIVAEAAIYTSFTDSVSNIRLITHLTIRQIQRY